MAANPLVDQWLPGEGTPIVLPMGHLLPDAPQQGIVINLADQRLYWFGDGTQPPISFAIGIGRVGWETPPGATTVTAKRLHPTWRPPQSIRNENPDLPEAVGPGPHNPLGDHAINLGWPAYVIHGTNRPYGIGRRVSHGCIRLYPADVARLFDLVGVGTTVAVVDQPLKIAWMNGQLFVEVHPTQGQADDIARHGFAPPDEIPGAYDNILGVAGPQAGRLDWDAISHALITRTGIPVQITR